MKNKSVLLIDDEQKLLDSTALLLQKYFKVIKACNGSHAWEYVNQQKFDCIVLDIEMPEMNGLEFLKNLRDKNKTTPVIVCTGKSCQQYAEQCADLGVNGYISKPYDVNKLICRIDCLVNPKETEDLYDEILKNINHPKLKEALDCIHGNYTRPISISCLSKSIGIDASYLGTLFRQNLGITFTIYLNRLRLEKAKWLLEETHLNVCEIMDKVGFSTGQHFYKQFKKYTGLSPEKFRRNRKK